MADSITWLLNADASAVRAEMDAAVQKVNSATGKIVHDLDGVTSTHNNLLRSDHRVAASLRGLASEAITTGDAFATVGKGLESLAMATNVSLPALIGLEIVGTLISKIAKAHEEAVKLNKELDAAGKPREPGSKIPVAEDVRQRRKVAEKARKDIEEKKANPWLTGTNWIWKAAAWIGENSHYKLGGSNDPTGIPGMRDEFQRRQGKPPELTDIQIEERKTKAAEDAASAIEKQAEAEKQLAELAKGVKNDLQFSLADIAKEGNKRKYGTFDSGRIYQGDLAQKALDEQALARKEMMANHPTEAMRHFNLAEQIKANIPALKDSEKVVLQLESANLTLKAIESKVSFERRSSGIQRVW